MKTLKIIWLIIVLFTFVELVSPLDYTDHITKYIVNALIVIGFISIVFNAKNKTHLIHFIIFGVYLLGISISFLIQTFSYGSEYKTQEILYREIKNPSNRIECVWSDVGAFGYNRTIHKVIQITPLFEWRTNTDTTNLDLTKWKEVNEYINELGLKGG